MRSVKISDLLFIGVTFPDVFVYLNRTSAIDKTEPKFEGKFKSLSFRIQSNRLCRQVN